MSSKSRTPRQIYLIDTLGLTHDPFEVSVAEQELDKIWSNLQFDFRLHHIEDKTEGKVPHLFSYYIDPEYIVSETAFPDLPLLESLLNVKNAFVFGHPGSGKTTLRYLLEAENRSVYGKTLVVTYELSDGITKPFSKSEHWTRIAKELATDLFIQSLEQFDFLRVPTDYQKRLFQEQMALIGQRGLRRIINEILRYHSNDLIDLSVFWPYLNRPAIRYNDYSPKIRNFLQDMIEKPLEEPHDSGESLLRKGVEAAKAWGFETIIVLVDGVDAGERKISNMMALIGPIVDELALWQSHELFFYFFLTEDMKDPIEDHYHDTLTNLPSPPFQSIIGWTEDALTELLDQRLQASGSRIAGFDALSSDRFTSSLTTYLIEASGNSPRRLIQLVSSLIDAHVDHDPNQPLITRDDCVLMQEKWEFGQPFPPDLPP